MFCLKKCFGNKKQDYLRSDINNRNMFVGSSPGVVSRPKT